MMRYIGVWLLALLVLAGCGRGGGEPSSKKENAGKAAQRLETVDTRPGTETVGAFGRPNNLTYGQVITAPPAPDRRLASFGFVMSVPATVVFRGHVYAWDGSHATGPSLWDGPSRSTTGAADEAVAFNPGILLTAGAQYVLFVSAADDAFADASGTLAAHDTDAYTGGTAVWLDHATAAEWTTTAWTAHTGDLAFTARFESVATETTASASVNPSVFGQSVTLTANVTAESGTPTGTVIFHEGATELGRGNLNAAGMASVSTSALSVGTHAITAEYAGDATYAASTSAAFDQVVNQAGTATTIVSSTNPSTIHQGITFTATVAAANPGAGTPTGTIEFHDGAVLLGTETLDAAGRATLSTSALALGSHDIQAAYSGSAQFAASTTSVAQAVNQDGATLTLATTPNPSSYGSSVDLVATVASVGPGGVPTGSVTFHEGATTLGTVALDAAGVATLATTSLLGGSHTLTAAYAGDANHTSASGGSTHVVNRAVSTTTSASLTNPSLFGQSVTFTATVTGGDVAPTGTVTFREGATTLGTATLAAGQASFSTTSLAAGPHAIVASYGGDANYAPSEAAAINQQVNKSATTTTLATSNTPSVAGANVTFTATVTATGGTPSGTVTFKEGATVLGTGALNAAGLATYTTNSLGVGSHTIVAEYGGDPGFATSSSAGLTQVVNQDGVSVALSGAPSPSTFGGSVTFTATVSSSGPGGVPSGTVTFKDGATVLGTGTLNATGVATYATSALAAGTHTIHAEYPGDVGHAGGTASTSQVVNPAATTTALASSANPSVFGQSVTFTATVTSAVAGTIGGTVTFVNGMTTLGTGALDATGHATFSIATFPVAMLPVVAVYDGAGNYATSRSDRMFQDVRRANTATAVASSSNPSLVGASVTFTATVTATAPGAGTPSGTVTFKEGATTLGTGTLDASGVATYATSTLTSGAHPITAEYGGDGSFNTSASPALTQNVNTFAATITVTSAPSPSNFGREVTLTAIVMGANGKPTGTVVFKNGATSIGTGTLDANGLVIVKTTSLPVGVLTLTASYSGDATYATGEGTVSHTVKKATSTTTLASSKNPSIVGDGVTFTASVTSEASSFGGTVEFFDGTTSLGKTTLTAGKATLVSSTLSEGGHAITARYQGDTNVDASTSVELTQVVNAKAPAPGEDAGTPDSGIEVPVVNNEAGGGGCSQSPAPFGGAGIAIVAGMIALAARRRRRA